MDINLTVKVFLDDASAAKLDTLVANVAELLKGQVEIQQRLDEVEALPGITEELKRHTKALQDAAASVTAPKT